MAGPSGHPDGAGRRLPETVEMVTQLWEFVESVEGRNRCCSLNYGLKAKKARPPTRGPGTARENDACSWFLVTIL